MFTTGLIILALSGPPQDSAAVKYSKEVTAEDLKKHLVKLASREFEGRETGKKGQKIAAHYLAKNFKDHGAVGPVNDTGFFQQYPLIMKNQGPIQFKVGRKKYLFLKDFYFFPGFPDVEINADSVVFAGYGIDSDTYSDFKNLNVKGKVIVALDGEPFDQEGKSKVTGSKEPSEWSNSWRLKSEAAIRNQAKAILILSEKFEQKLAASRHFVENPYVKLDIPVKDKKPSIPFLYISKQIGEKLLDKNIAELKGSGGTSFVSKKKFKLKVDRPAERILAENVVAFIPGKELKDEVIVISAHYDHLGKTDTTIYYGADDDGSGTAALLTLSKAFARASKEGYGPKRSIAFVAFSGEEKGLLGSEYYSENPVFPLKNTIANLNIDMIGRLDKKHQNNPDYIYIIGSDKLSTQLHNLSENVNRTYSNLELDYTYNDLNDPNRYYYRSDHYNFAKKNVPVIFYFNGTHEDYHKASDTVDKIDFKKMEKISRLVFFTAWELANRKERPVVDRKTN